MPVRARGSIVQAEAVALSRREPAVLSLAIFAGVPSEALHAPLRTLALFLSLCRSGSPRIAANEEVFAAPHIRRCIFTGF